MTCATRVEVNRQCEQLIALVRHCVIIRSAHLYYVRRNRWDSGGSAILMEWRKLTRKRATEVGMDSRLFERTI